ncbi:hypothetical protein OAP13_05295 [Gammaproteobacteria bacterium]|nr:hypothetical protein [SAR86 cluster bacterium]MDC0577926.1 hypothetical protein [Gammaproteobacteria bacterium]MDC0591306.1 hypothetical protein [Gammaproteobacteria bacterium]|tara:strand:+ start:4374 stop:4607 length:234 start_codon:yes stop_codon:yes gene_type:complete
MLNYIERIKIGLWELTKLLSLLVAVAVLVSTLFGTNVPFFGNILVNVQTVIGILGSEGLGLIIAIIIILSVWNSRST